MDPKIADFSDFASLIRWLIDEHHAGIPYRMARHLGVGSAVIALWLKRKTTSPSVSHVGKLCDTYHLDYDAVQALISKSKSRPIGLDVSDLKSLMRWIANEFHGGRRTAIARRVGVSNSLVYFWFDGTVKQPKSDTLMKICLAYDLDISAVRARLSKRR